MSPGPCKGPNLQHPAARKSFAGGTFFGPIAEIVRPGQTETSRVQTRLVPGFGIKTYQLGPMPGASPVCARGGLCYPSIDGI